MRSLLIIGADVNQHKDRYMDFAFNFLKVGFDVTLHWVVNEAIEGEFLVEQAEKNHIKSWFDLRDCMDWARMEKEIKTHTLTWILPSERMIHALSLAKVYGRDVWCLLDGHATPTEMAFLETADYIILQKKEGAEAFNRLMERLSKKMVLVFDAKHNRCEWYKNGEKRLFLVESPVMAFDFDGFSVALLKGDLEGEYAAERLATAVAGALLYPNLTAEEVERLSKNITVTEGVV